MRGAAGRLLEHTQTSVSATPKLALKEAMPGVGVGERECVCHKQVKILSG